MALIVIEWPSPAHLMLEKIDNWNKLEMVIWMIDFFKWPHLDHSEITLKCVVKDPRGKNRTKEVGCVCYAFAHHDDMLEVWWELLKSKQLRRSLLPMSKLDCGMLTGNRDGGLNEMYLEFKVVPDMTAIKYTAIINEARMKLLQEWRSNSHVWWFLSLS
ncbi:hypothetical protein R1flu_000575 [Riccia fluitans]|uniref:Uncharacterized protein n=1 Tax=Riccia fluitans TaxID=41844 RepID=A0ABD1Y0U6_9MARC